MTKFADTIRNSQPKLGEHVTVMDLTRTTLEFLERLEEYIESKGRPSVVVLKSQHAVNVQAADSKWDKLGLALLVISSDENVDGHESDLIGGAEIIKAELGALEKRLKAENRYYNYDEITRLLPIKDNLLDAQESLTALNEELGLDTAKGAARG